MKADLIIRFPQPYVWGLPLRCLFFCARTWALLMASFNPRVTSISIERRDE